jgi:hypothetical protein
MNSKVKHIRDADPSKQLVAPGGAAIVASGQSAAKSLDKLNLAYWDNGELPWATIGAQIAVQTADRTTGDETYAFSLEVSADAAFTVPVEVAKITVTSIGGYILAVDADTARSVLPAAAFIRLRYVLAGTTPSATFHAWLVHIPQ